jgi:hypothetical protein
VEDDQRIEVYPDGVVGQSGERRVDQVAGRVELIGDGENFTTGPDQPWVVIRGGTGSGGRHV